MSLPKIVDLLDADVFVVVANKFGETGSSSKLLVIDVNLCKY